MILNLRNYLLLGIYNFILFKDVIILLKFHIVILRHIQVQLKGTLPITILLPLAVNVVHESLRVRCLLLMIDVGK